MRRIKRLLKKCFSWIVIPAYAGIQRIDKKTGFPIKSGMTWRKVFFLVRVEGESAWPVLMSGRRYLASGFAASRVGDFAVFRNPKDPARVFVKRVSGIERGSYRMESMVSWGSSSDDFGAVPRELILGKIIL